MFNDFTLDCYQLSAERSAVVVSFILLLARIHILDTGKTVEEIPDQKNTENSTNSSVLGTFPVFAINWISSPKEHHLGKFPKLSQTVQFENLPYFKVKIRQG